MVIATIVFIVSAVGIAALFALKYAEAFTGRTLLPELRARADERALSLKMLLGDATVFAAHIPPIAAQLSRTLVREIALGFAAFARFLERQAHAIADMVSHKRGFERRAPRSEFLKQMNGEAHEGPLETTDENGHNA